MDGLQANKMASKEQATLDISEALSKYGIWACYVLIGILGKFGYDIVSRRKITWWYFWGTGLMSIFVGFISSKWFMVHDPTSGAYFVPVLTLVSRDVLVFLMLMDWKKILGIMFRLDNKKGD